MKVFLLIINLIFCYSNILDKIRENEVNKALLYLPERSQTNILKMGKEMSKVKEQFSLTNLETAYFVYKWIALKIEFDCKSFSLGNSSELEVTVYNEGKGGPIGIAQLFNTFCNILEIESNTILGLTKLITYNFDKIIQIKDYAWNYVLIDNEYYLLDAGLGSGYCYGGTFIKKYTDFYFGTEPEKYIRLHYPNEDKWQLLSDVISKSEFQTMAYLFEGFYSLGFKTIYPDNQTLTEDTIFQLTSDSSFDEIYEDIELNSERDIYHEMPMFSVFSFKKI